MSCCRRSTRQRHKVHNVTLDASSAFEAAEKASRPWSLLRWFNPNAIITVQRGEQRWNIAKRIEFGQCVYKLTGAAGKSVIAICEHRIKLAPLGIGKEPIEGWARRFPYR